MLHMPRGHSEHVIALFVQAGRQAGRQAGGQAGRGAGRQARGRAGRQGAGQAGRQAGRLELRAHTLPCRLHEAPQQHPRHRAEQQRQSPSRLPCPSVQPHLAHLLAQLGSFVWLGKGGSGKMCRRVVEQQSCW